jgi:hypothetical protein
MFACASSHGVSVTFTQQLSTVCITLGYCALVDALACLFFLCLFQLRFCDRPICLEYFTVFFLQISHCPLTNILIHLNLQVVLVVTAFMNYLVIFLIVFI